MMSTVKIQMLIHVVYLLTSPCFHLNTETGSSESSFSYRSSLRCWYFKGWPPRHTRTECVTTRSHLRMYSISPSPNHRLSPRRSHVTHPSHRTSKQIRWVPRCDWRSLNVDDSWSPSRPTVGRYERERNPILLQRLISSPVRHNAPGRDQRGCHRWVHLTLNWATNNTSDRFCE